jgi:ATP-dependent helicase/nuclease subunit B
LFHAIQFRLLSELRLRGLLPITTANQPHVLEIADVVVAAVSDTYREELAPAIPRIWDGEVENIRWDVRGWLRSMVEPENGWTPRWFELSFGLTYARERDPASRDDTIDLPSGLRLRGSIDMVEEREGRLRVTDHKTGKAPFVPPGYIGRGEVLQPILYAQAAEALLGKPVQISRLFYCTERGGYKSIEFPINDDSRAAMDKVIRTIDSSLTSGFLPVAPREGACRWCDYQNVCGPYEEIRVRRKPKDRLALLDEIRKS